MKTIMPEWRSGKRACLRSRSPELRWFESSLRYYMQPWRIGNAAVSKTAVEGPEPVRLRPAVLQWRGGRSVMPWAANPLQARSTRALVTASVAQPGFGAILTRWITQVRILPLAIIQGA